MLQLYNIADITVIPSLDETFSLTALESLASGTPIAGFDVDSIKFMTQDGKMGMWLKLVIRTPSHVQ